MSSNGSLSPSNSPPENYVFMESISSSSDFSDSDETPPRQTEQRRKIFYCFICEQSAGETCWDDEHLIFDISDIIRVSVGTHFVSFYETIAKLDRAYDQRTKYAGVLNTVKVSLERLKQNVDEKIDENSRQMAQLMAAKKGITTRRDNLISNSDASGHDREQFRSYTDACSKTFTAPCASAAQLDMLYASLEQAQFKLIVESQSPMDWSNHINCIFNGPLNILDALDNVNQNSTAGDVRRVVGFALATAESSDGLDRLTRTSISQLNHVNAGPLSPTTRITTMPLPALPTSAPPPLRASDIRNYTTEDNFPPQEPPAPPPIQERTIFPTQMLNNPLATRPSSIATTTANSIYLPPVSTPNLDRQQDSPVSENVEELYEVADALLTTQRQDHRIRESNTNTCTWHPVNSWLAITSNEGAEAVIWILPPQNKKKLDKQSKSLSASTPNLSSKRERTAQNIRVRLDHSSDRVCQITWNPIGTILATGSKSGMIRFWETGPELSPTRPPEAESMEENGHDGDVSVIKFSPSGKYIMSGGTDTKVFVWDAERFCLHQTFTFHNAAICDVDWKSDSKTFVSCDYEGAIVIGTIGQQQPLRSIVDYPRWVKAVRWDYSGEFLASCSVDSTLQVWNQVLEDSSPKELKGHNRSVNAISWRPSSEMSPSKKNSNIFLASGSDDGAVIIWDIESNTSINCGSKSKSKSSVKCLAFSPDGKILAAGREDGCLDFCFVKSGKPVASTKLLSNPIHKIEWDATGTLVAAAVGKTGAQFIDYSKLGKRSFTLWPFSD